MRLSLKPVFYLAANGGGFETVDTAGFDAAIVSFEKALAVYQEARSVLTTRTNILNRNWDGKGAKSFEDAQKSIVRFLEDDGDSLQAIIDNLRTIRQVYQDWDSQTAQKMDNPG